MDLSNFKPTKEDVAALERALELIRATRGVELDQTTDCVIEAAEIRRAIKARRLRDRFFGSGLFEEPAWDMLLDLLASELEHRRVSVSALGIASAVAPTTALRWISKLTDSGLLVRVPDQLDRRRAHIELSNKAGLAMRQYIAAMRRDGLSLA